MADPTRHGKSAPSGDAMPHSIGLGGVRRPPPQPKGTLRAFALALLMHGLLIAMLFVGLRWQTSAPEGIAAELWEPVVQANGAEPETPKEPPKLAKAEPEPEPEPEPVPEPEPEPVPQPEPAQAQPEPTPPAKPDIALEQERKAREEAERRAEAERRQREARQRAEEEARKEAEEKARLAAEEKARREAEEKARKEAEVRARQEAEAKAKREA